MSIFRAVLAACAAGVVLAPLAAGATVQFDQFQVNNSTQVAVDGAVKSATANHLYNSLPVLEGGVLKSANSLSIKSTGAAQADSSTGARFTSASSGGYGFVQDAASSVTKKTATATSYGMAGSSVDYLFSITGPLTYDISINGQASGSATGNGQNAVYDTFLYDDTTGKFLFLNKIGVGDSFSSVIKDLAVGVYEIGSADWDDIYSYSYGCGCTSGFAGDSADFYFSLSAAPEPGEWALMVLGIGLIGAALRISARVNRELDQLRA